MTDSANEVAAVLALRRAFWGRGYRPLAVWNPDEHIDDKGEPLGTPGKQPRGRWRRDATLTPPRAVQETPDPRALNTGILCGDIVGFDIDVPLQELADRIVHLVETMLGSTPLVRIGQAPKILLVYRTVEAFTKLQTPELFFTDGTTCKVEVLAGGQQFVAAGIHPVTKRRYVWTDGSPAEVAIADLPVVNEEQARLVVAEAEKVLHAAGAAAKKPRAKSAGQVGGGGDFFHHVNTAALAALERWVSTLFPYAKFQPGTGAWRVSSADLERDLEEDLSFHPSGITDYGLEKTYTPLDTVIEYGGAPDAVAAALWLCEQLEIEPETFGFRGRRRSRSGGAQQTNGLDEAEIGNATRPGPAGISTIRVLRGERHLAADAGLAALVKAGIEFYIRGPDLVRVAPTPIKTAGGDDLLLPGIVRVSPAACARALGQAARWEKINWKGEIIRIDPPAEVVEQIHAMNGEWPFPPLNGVITCPTLRPDGSLFTAAGYDSATALYLSDTLTLPPLPQQPTRDDAVAALAFLNELLDGFPFVGADSRAVALSMLITPVVRAAVAPVAPLHLVKAPQPGTGKSYLANLASLIATGKPCAVIAVDKTLEETEKRLVGAILSGHPIISIDNARELLQGSILCQAIEQPLLELRRLGTSDMIEVANAIIVFANGNNLTIADDLVRRTITCHLDANVENPETRTFKFDPTLMVQRHRGAYVAACLTIVRAYLAAGLPERQPSLPSFGAWSDRVRSALCWLGCSDPVSTMAAARDDDPVRLARAEVFRAWAEELGLSCGYQTAELTEAAEKDYSFNGAMVLTHPQLHAALIAVAAQPYRQPPKIDNVRLGQWLSRNVNTIAGKYKLIADRRDKQRIRWELDIPGEEI